MSLLILTGTAVVAFAAGLILGAVAFSPRVGPWAYRRTDPAPVPALPQLAAPVVIVTQIDRPPAAPHSELRACRFTPCMAPTTPRVLRCNGKPRPNRVGRRTVVGRLMCNAPSRLCNENGTRPDLRNHRRGVPAVTPHARADLRCCDVTPHSSPRAYPRTHGGRTR